MLTIAIDALRKYGLWDENKYRGVIAGGGLRTSKSNYSQDNLLAEKAAGESYLEHSEGGPEVREMIYAPKLENTKNPSGKRQARSLAHELTHALRALTNKMFGKAMNRRPKRQVSGGRKQEIRIPRTSLRYARGILVPLRATHDLELALSANLHPRATSRGFKIGEE